MANHGPLCLSPWRRHNTTIPRLQTPFLHFSFFSLHLPFSPVAFSLSLHFILLLFNHCPAFLFSFLCIMYRYYMSCYISGHVHPLSVSSGYLKLKHLLIIFPKVQLTCQHQCRLISFNDPQQCRDTSLYVVKLSETSWIEAKPHSENPEWKSMGDFCNSKDCKWSMIWLLSVVFLRVGSHYGFSNGKWALSNK